MGLKGAVSRARTNARGRHDRYRWSASLRTLKRGDSFYVKPIFHLGYEADLSIIDKSLFMPLAHVFDKS